MNGRDDSLRHVDLVEFSDVIHRIYVVKGEPPPSDDEIAVEFRELVELQSKKCSVHHH